MQNWIEKIYEYEQYILELARVFYEKWAKIVFECSLIKTEL